MKKLNIPVLVFCLILSPQVWTADFTKLFSQVDPTVVVLHTYHSTPDPQKNERTVTSPGLGSGVVVSSDGKVLTAAYVVHTADSVHVEFKDGTKVLGHVISSEPAADLPMLQLASIPERMALAPLGDSDKVGIGNEVIVIGSPYGFNHTLTVGHISARHLATEMGDDFLLGEFFQTDAAINRGNSGGPVFNTSGKLIGIVSHIQSKSGGYEGLGFAVTSNTARRLMLERKGFWSGINGISVTPTLAKAINFPLKHGVLVQKVAEESAARQAGIQGGSIPAQVRDKKLLLGGDIIVSVLGIPIKSEKSIRQIREKIEQINPGDGISAHLLQ